MEMMSMFRRVIYEAASKCELFAESANCGFVVLIGVIPSTHD